MSGSVQQEFFRWIGSLDFSDLMEVDIKMINLLISNYQSIEKLGTAGGKRAKLIGELIQMHNQTLPREIQDLKLAESSVSDKVTNITKLEIGPFRGFATSESFPFNKKYTFIYGANGSGKSSFCEGLEYALLGNIEEADARRIAIIDYVKNANKGLFIKPKALGKSNNQQVVEILNNQAAYRYSFIEKNRVDGFARITATTSSIQKDRIATLFGLDAFSDFVDGFTEELDNRYITLINQLELDFKAESQKREEDERRIKQLEQEYLENSIAGDQLIKTAAIDGIIKLDQLKIFLSGTDGLSGIINELQQKRVELIPSDIDVRLIDSITIKLPLLRHSIDGLDEKLRKLESSSSEVNYKALYSAIIAINTEPTSDKTRCPACKTPIDKVMINPFENANIELSKLSALSTLQEEINEKCIALSKSIIELNTLISTINKTLASIEIGKPAIPLLTAILFTEIGSIDVWKNRLSTELETLENNKEIFTDLRNAISNYNASLLKKRNQKSSIDTELQRKRRNQKSSRCNIG